MILTGIQGGKSNFKFKLTQNGFEVENIHTGEKQEATITKGGRYKIKDTNNKYRYFTLEQIGNYYNRERIKKIPKEEQNIRNNVEATMFQLSFFTRNNKIRYRGLVKTQMWANMRCLWINLIRIKNYREKIYPDTNEIKKIVQNLENKREVFKQITNFVQIICFKFKNEINMLIFANYKIIFNS